ncbi:YveK family protein [Paenibacillus sp. SEL1]|uniref:YveK family protein n=1 Tax=Paenibacillus TaxID=44249 RepID=UPI0004D982D1|nr:Wzz/FepE/Etk N-terminal domain-containing protein [Paenibacillus polymyxa]MCP3795711.1 Wzz/FepE/Etk N-terminal domain-containing protein [Paenibacillus sp. CH40]MCP3808777.1 Wzz/FepE/Etk N-terminal domain-containing protein [Paenibacillus sp. Lou8.1]KEO80160.1 lipopolysaccharide biosynthesis protein [Paenibacillus polymyxa]KYG94510.1 lipopolysaccharide biosynthesis protein [Paenibacillus polymyxa]MCH6186265.1 Wzz/FepE/Etk N-terminal domain-containing protein [Paenibacillus polymyxa]
MQLKEYIRLIRKRMWLIGSIVLLVCTVVGIKNVYFTPQIYEATAKLIINQTPRPDRAGVVDYSVVQTNIALTNSYKQIMISSAIMDQVVASFPDLKVTPSALAQKLRVNTAGDSQVMDVTIRDLSYTKAVKTVNAVAKVFKRQIPSIMKMDNVTILSEASLNDPAVPVNSNPAIQIFIAFVTSLLLGIGLAFLLEVLDDTFKNEEDIEKELGLPTLSLITKMKKEDKRSDSSTTTPKQVGEGQYAAINQ